jgi:soluble lytic murein transglycosylase-like protein
MISRVLLGCACAAAVVPAQAADRTSLDALVSRHAAANGIPETLVHRVIRRESNYNPRAVSRGNFGLMQIRHATARGMGYAGPASGLLDADTNLTYAVAYLANAYRVAGGNADRAVRLYSTGYYYEAKRRGMAPVRAAMRQSPAVAPQPAAVMPTFPLQAPAVPGVQVVQSGFGFR